MKTKVILIAVYLATISLLSWPSVRVFSADLVLGAC